jgi:DNA-directed RNA polymerase specialized sigma24 family protein
MDESLETWFKREILPQEAAFLRYLFRVWPKRDEITDLRQEVYARVFESARASRPQMPRAFLFATARNLMADRVRRARVVSNGRTPTPGVSTPVAQSHDAPA